MSLLRFNKEEIKSWADFSGDYNPIHFDDSIAEAAIGSGGIVMPGMLAMIPMKASHSAMSWESGGWIQWKAMLRQAMPLHAGYRLESRVVEANRQIRFKLVDNEDAQVKISGQCAVMDFNTTPYDDYRRITIPTEEVHRELEGFASRFPDTPGGWVAIDALIFSRYIRHHADEVFQEAVAHYTESETPGLPPPENIVAMQTHHHDIFSGSLLQNLKSSEINKFEYSYRKSEEILTRNSVFLMIEIPVWINDNLVQVVEIGLMARSVPPAKP